MFDPSLTLLYVLVIDTSTSVRAEEKSSQPTHNTDQRAAVTTATTNKKSSGTLHNAGNGASKPTNEREMSAPQSVVDWQSMDWEVYKSLAYEGKWDILLSILPPGTQHLDAL